jgi:alcohol dehydrogenase class IV
LTLERAQRAFGTALDLNMRFEFATATRILFGSGTLRDVAPLARGMGNRALVVTGWSAGRAAPLLSGLSAASVSHGTFTVSGEPTLALVEDGVRQLNAGRADLVISIGGGSVVDAGKAIAALATNHGGLLDYLEVIGKAKALEQPPLPFIAIPTTAGTGAEVTRNAVLASPEHRVKASLRSPLLVPKLAVIDPELTLGLPPALTATTGLDALTQLVEPFVSCRANPMTDGFCREGLVRAARSLRRAFEQPGDLAAREDMALASLLSGLALANSGLGSVHGFAASIGGMFPAPHGAVCAALLPHAMDVNLRALRQRQPQGEALARYTEVARLLTGRAGASAGASVEWVRSLCADLQIPSLRTYGLAQADLAALCYKAGQSSSMKGNPLPLTPEELKEVLERAL